MRSNTLLLVCGDYLLRWALRKRIASKRLPFDVAENLRDGLRRIRETRYAVVILDLSLPDGNGLELLREIGWASPGAKVIVMSPDAMPESRRLAYFHGAFLFLEKPFDLAEFNEAIDRCFGSQPEKRKIARRTAHMTLRITPLAADRVAGETVPAAAVPGVAIDVGAGGLRLVTAHPLRPGDRVRLEPVGGGDPAGDAVFPETVARVIWTIPDEEGVTAGLEYLRAGETVTPVRTS